MSRRAPKTEPSPRPVVPCAIYCRKSSEEGLRQEFNSLDAQREAGEAYIRSQKAAGWTCSDTHYEDGGYTGGNMDRPGLKQLLADIEAGKVQVVVVYKIDRLSRSLLDFAKMIALFEEHGVAFVSVTQAFDTSSPMGRLTLNILLSFAQFEREIIGERIRDKIGASRRKGKWTGGTPILGYDVDRSGPSPKLVVNSIEAARVLQIFELYLELGGLLPVVAELERRGWRNKAWTTLDGRPRGGFAFDKCRLGELLRNILYVGKLKHRGEIYDAEHEPIVPLELFERVQKQLRTHSSSVGPRSSGGALLRGLLHCRACGRPMTRSFTTRGPRRYSYYVCASAAKRGRAACATPSLPAAEIENVVVEQIAAVAKDADLVRTTVREARQQIKSAIARLETERATVTAALRRSRTDMSHPGPTNGAAQVLDVQAQIQHYEDRLAVIASEILSLVDTRLTERDVRAALADLPAVWAALSPREQGRLLQLLISRVDFNAADSTVAVTFSATGIRAASRPEPINPEEAAA